MLTFEVTCADCGCDLDHNTQFKDGNIEVLVDVCEVCVDEICQDDEERETPTEKPEPVIEENFYGLLVRCDVCGDLLHFESEIDQSPGAPTLCLEVQGCETCLVEEAAELAEGDCC
jgi:hypothetical protein